MSGHSQIKGYSKAVKAYKDKCLASGTQFCYFCGDSIDMTLHDVTTKPLIPYVDCLIGNEEDFQSVLGYEVEGVDVEKGEIDTTAFKKMVTRVVNDFPNIKIVGTTLRGVKSALINDWSAIMWHDGKFYDGISFPGLEIEDRVGGGDGFASGFTYGFLTGKDPQTCVNTGVAHGALLMTTRGDSSQITLEELQHVAAGGSARIKR